MMENFIPFGLLL